MSATLAITALLLWLAVFLEAHNAGIVRRSIAVPFLLLVMCSTWLFERVSGWTIDQHLVDPELGFDPTEFSLEVELL